MTACSPLPKHLHQGPFQLLFRFFLNPYREHLKEVIKTVLLSGSNMLNFRMCRESTLLPSALIHTGKEVLFLFLKFIVFSFLISKIVI